MKTLYLDLLFHTSRKDDLPGPPIAHIAVKSCGKFAKKTVLGAQCVTYEEVDEQIRGLEKELASIRRKAKKRFEAVEQKRSPT